MKRNVVIALSCLLMVLSLFISCGNDSQVDASREFEGEQVVVYARFMEDDAKWLSDSVWYEFEQNTGAKVVFKPFDDPNELPNLLDLGEANDLPTIFLTPNFVGDKLVKDGKVMPVSEYDVGGAYSELFTDESIAGYTIDGVQYYTPWNEHTYMVIYLKEPVEDAVANWASVKEEVNESLKAYNGYGLPDGYSLESDVNDWDYYDLAIVSYYWSKTEYNGLTAPRLAHRGLIYDATMSELVSKAYQLGGNIDEILEMDNTSVIDMYRWEDYFATEGMYIPEMWTESWSGGAIYQAMADGACFLAFMHINDACTIHGLGTPSVPGYLANPDDMGVAISPMGVSLDIENGAPVYTGGRSSAKWSYGWGVLEGSPNKELSFELIKWMMAGKPEHISHWEEVGQATPFKDFVNDPSKYVKEKWMIDAYTVHNEQAKLSQLTPVVPQYAEIGVEYMNAWHEIVKDNEISDVEEIIQSTYAPSVKSMLE